MVIEVVSQGSFAASHQLKDHPGKCHNLHGHTWNYEVTINGDIDEETGMLFDYGLIDEVINQLDHQHLNKIVHTTNPTSERTALWIQKEIWKQVRMLVDAEPDKRTILFVMVKLWESPRHHVIV